MVEVITIVLIFVRGIFEAILNLLGISITSGMMGSVYLVISVLCYFSFLLFAAPLKLSNKSIRIISVLLLILILFLVTTQRYGGINDLVKSQLLYYGSASISAALMGILIAEKGTLKSIGKWLPVISVILTVSVFLCLLFSKGVNSSNQLFDDSGITYQNASYYGSAAFGMTMFYLNFSNSFKTFKIFDYLKPLLYLMIILQIFIAFNAGGRGGFLLFFVYVMYFLYVNVRRNKLSIKTVGAILGGGVIAIIAFVFISNTSLSSYGLDRILNLLNGKTNTSDRFVLYEAAFEAFKKSPIIGNGIASVFYEVGYYSHNVLMDILCDGGVIGVLLFLILIFWYIRKQLKCEKDEPVLGIVLIFFLYGFVMSLVSSFYLCNHVAIFSLSYMYVYDSKRRRIKS